MGVRKAARSEMRQHPTESGPNPHGRWAEMKHNYVRSTTEVEPT